MLRSPLEDLDMPVELACEFFGHVARFEYTLKEAGFIQRNRPGVWPDWRGFAAEISAQLKVRAGSDLEQAIDFLCASPPAIQTGSVNWRQKHLAGDMPIAQALDAAYRVRNNLFHGGKHTGHSPAGRDEQLVRHALCLIRECVVQHGVLRTLWERP